MLHQPAGCLTGSLSPLSFTPMKTLAVDLPDALASQLDELVRAGLYLNSQEAVRHALQGFLENHAAALGESHQLVDIDWALRETPDR